LSGGALSWDGSFLWSLTLTLGALAHQMPIYFQQVMNEAADASTDSTVQPFMFARANQTSGSQMAMFSDTPISSDQQCICDAQSYPDTQCAHLVFNENRSQVLRWIRGVHDFMVHYGVW